MAKSTCRFTQDDIIGTKAYKELTPMMKNITRNKRNIIAIENGCQVARARGYQLWERESKARYANKLIVKELLEKITTGFPWETNQYQDDFICKMGDYTLRIEKMDKNNWWWQLYFKNDAIAGTWFCDEEHYWPDTKDRAMELCEEAYLSNVKI